MLQKYGERVHKIAINAGFTCPNRDGSKGVGGCTFCNNRSFNPIKQNPPTIAEQIAAGQSVIRRRTGAQKFLAYFQAYTNTYADVAYLAEQYEQALADEHVIGLSIGTRPDCVPGEVLELLCHYRDRGHEVWLELGLQSAHDRSLQKVNRGHDFSEYQQAVKAIRQYGLPLCTHLILGMPGENEQHMHETLLRVIATGVDALKLHPLHVVRGTQLARQWKHAEYQPLTMQQYINIAANLIEITPADTIYHRVTGTAQSELLLAPEWCVKKWAVINGIEDELRRRNSYQGYFCSSPELQQRVVM